MVGAYKFYAPYEKFSTQLTLEIYVTKKGLKKDK